MAKHGTLPEYLYQRRLEVGDKVNLNFGVDEDEGQLFRRKAFSHPASRASFCLFLY